MPTGGGSRPKSEEQPHAIAGRSLGNYAASWCSGPGGISGCNGLSAAAIERVALTKTWVLDKLIENVDRAHRSRWSPRARGEGWWPIIRLIGLQGALVVDALLLGLFVPRARRLRLLRPDGSDGQARAVRQPD